MALFADMMDELSEKNAEIAKLRADKRARDRRDQRARRARRKRGLHRVTFTAPHAWIRKLVEQRYLGEEHSSKSYPVAFESFFYAVRYRVECSARVGQHPCCE